MTPLDKDAGELEIVERQVEAELPIPDWIASQKVEPVELAPELGLAHERIAMLENDARDRSREMIALMQREEMLGRRVNALMRDLDRAHQELAGYRDRERQILALVMREQRGREEQAYWAMQQTAPVNQVPQSVEEVRQHVAAFRGGVTDAVEQGRLTAAAQREYNRLGLCDCTMDRHSMLLQDREVIYRR